MNSNCLVKLDPRLTVNQGMSCWQDEALISWISHNPARACEGFTILAQRHHPKILRRCAFRLGNQHDAEDATQDILLRVQARLEQFEGRSKFTTWLNTVCDNYCNTFLQRRSKYVYNERMDELLETLELDVSSDDPYIVLSDTEIVDKVMSKLSSNDREIINLRFYHDSSLEDISRTLSIKLSATKARLYRSIDRFKQLYAQLDGSQACVEIV